VVLPEDLCARLTVLAEADSRTVSNMAKVMIQQGIERLEHQRVQDRDPGAPPAPPEGTDRFRAVLERQEQRRQRRLRGVPRRLRVPRQP
jgi:hypothetical protein